ncbi:MAG: FprA family A-type flavoprotein [Chloroflexi bacterium]|nr:FprA family A-type flavoprotein [Chloroflexota bacterium]
MRTIRDRVDWLGAIDWDRRLFDSLIPLPDGTSYNAYVVKGSEKVALLDTVDPAMVDLLLAQLEHVPHIDYLVAHHAEQDHSGSIGVVLDKYPQATLLCTPKAKTLLIEHLAIPEERIRTVADGETVSLGDRTLQFLHLPWVHWPETMGTYVPEEGILFSCDLFGSHLATTDLYVTDEGRAYEAAKCYYAEIMMPFRRHIEKHLARLHDIAIDVIAPSHAPMYDRPAFILDAYREWVSGPPKNEVVIPYISMHGSTRRMVTHLIDALAHRGVTAYQFDLSGTDIGKVAIALVDAATVVLATPTVHAGPHPEVLYAAYLANALRPKAEFASIIGSYGWGGKTVEILAGQIGNLKVEVLEPVLCLGLPKPETYAALDKLADAIAEKHKARGLA